MRLVSMLALSALALVVLPACNGNKSDSGNGDTDTGHNLDNDSAGDSQADSGDTDTNADTAVNDADGDGYTTAQGDCNDTNPTINPGATETCNGLDDNCNGQTDEGVQNTYYKDGDGDGYGGTTTEQACAAPPGYTAQSGDCNDASTAYHPGASESDCTDPNDYNCDGSAGAVDNDGDGYFACEECDDGNAAVNPSAAEVCNGIDDDCDGTIDVGAVDAPDWYTDADGDGYGEDGTATASCTEPAGTASVAGDCNDADTAYHPGAPETDCTDPNDYNCDGSSGYADADGDGVPACEDCDDTNAAVNPSASEVCDGIDNNCDGVTDGADATGGTTWYADLDGDGYGDDTDTVTACSAPDGYVASGGDCNDLDVAYHPGAPETSCTDTNDYNCDGNVGYADADGDGVPACEDCDDANPLAYPGAIEVCDGFDDDCDGTIDVGAVNESTWYADVDSDGYGDDSSTVGSCDAPAGFVSVGGDCNDADPAYNPGATETCSDPNDYNCDGSTGYADADGDGVPACDDCNDADASVNPSATEICDGVDNNCDGNIDEAGAAGETTWYQDTDGDGYGDASTSVVSCSAPAGYVADSTDCDDSRANFHPGAPETDCTDPNDYNCDGSVGYADADGDGVAACDDCDDANPAAYPGGAEVCDGADNDCNGVVDDGASDATLWYVDSDVDGYGDPTISLAACTAPSGFIADNTDCDDARAADHPGATEVCDGHDNDCDGVIDNGAAGMTDWYADADSDGYGNPAISELACDAPSNYVADNTDCNDAAGAINPGAAEVCDGVDNNCDGNVDEGLDGTYYLDFDGDGYGDPTVAVSGCRAPGGYVADNTDCDDTDGTSYPGAPELCDGVDNDCDGTIDNGATTTFYADSDEDGYGDPAVTAEACVAPANYVDDATDCDDGDPDINPAANDVCDGVDNDCDGTADNDPAFQTAWYADADGDSYGNASSSTLSCTQPANTVTNATDCDDAHSAAHPGGVEVCDGLDNDCDGTADNRATDAGTWYLDADHDTYGGTTTATSCSQPAGYVSTSTDCDDGNGGVHPGASEVCDGIDNNCDGVVDTDAVDQTTWYQDSDNDNYGSTVTEVSCTQPDQYVRTPGDCDDGNDLINPAAPEICNEIDDNCNDLVDDSPVDGTTYHLDFDNDTYGGTTSMAACSQPAGYVVDGTDCDDTDANSYPGATEVCDGADNNCDGTIDNSAVDATTWYQDADKDTYGNASVSSLSCDAPAHYVADNTDCDDTKNKVNPAATETCNGIDDNCDGNIDEAGATGETSWYVDADGDGYGAGTATVSACNKPSGYASTNTDCDDADNTTYPGATEVCEDGVDNDCDNADLTDSDCRYTTTTTTTAIVSTTSGDTIYGAAASDYFGTAIAGNADVNGDGKTDVAIGAPGYDSAASTNNYGRVYVWYGAVATTDTTTTADAVYTAKENGEAAGNSIAFIPDYTSDSKAEVLIGAWKRNGSTGTDSGGAYIFAGGTASADVTSARTTITGTTGNEGAGYVVLGGNLDGNTTGDLVVTAPSNGSTSTSPNGGSVNVWYDGIATGSVSISAAELRLTGTTAADYFGAAASNGDVDGDGVDDLFIGAPGVDKSSTTKDVGEAYFEFGNSSTTGTIAAASTDIQFTNSTASDELGYSVAVLGDIDGDGYADLGVGGDKIDNGATIDTGKVYLIAGSGIASGATSGSVAVTTAAAATLTGSNASDYLGKLLQGVGDFDSDGYADFVVGAPGYDNGATTEVGIYYLEYGTPGFSPTTTAGWYMPDAASGTSPTSVVPMPDAIGRLGDVDGDGYDDVGLGSGAAAHGATAKAGAAWLIYGTGL